MHASAWLSQALTVQLSVTHRAASFASAFDRQPNHLGKESVDGVTSSHQTGSVEPPVVRILLVEDHETVRHGLRLLIDRESDLKVVGEASDGAEAIARGQLDDLDVVVMDLSMPGMSGLVATRRLKAIRPELAIVSLTRHADKTFLQELLRAGACGYVLKQSPHAELFRAIRAAATGRQYIDPALTHHLAAPFVAHAREARRRGRGDRTRV